MSLVVFLDIDGTILYEPHEDDDMDWGFIDGQYVGDGIEELLEFVCERCEPYWLSYRARLGRRDILETYILPHLPPIAREIGIARWDKFKHEGLITDRPFLWFDDYPEPEDEEWLRARNLSDCLVKMEHTGKDNPIRILRALKQHPELSTPKRP